MTNDSTIQQFNVTMYSRPLASIRLPDTALATVGRSKTAFPRLNHLNPFKPIEGYLNLFKPSRKKVSRSESTCVSPRLPSKLPKYSEAIRSNPKQKNISHRN